MFFKDNGQHTTIVVSPKQLIKSEIIVNNKGVSHSIVYRGVALIPKPENQLILQILKAESTAFSHSPETAIPDYTPSTGSSIVLVGGLQARNNARVIITGSVDMFANDFLEVKT